MSATTPILLTTGLTIGNDWYQGKGLNFKAALGGGLAVIIAAALSEVDGLGPVVTGIAWIAFVAALVIPEQQGKQTPLDTLVKLTGG